MAKQSQKLDGFAGVYHYVHNQSMITPLFHAAGMPYLGAVYGSDLDYLYNNMFPRDKLSESDTQVSDTFIESFVNFAYTGRPSSKGLSPWPQLFPAPGDLGESKFESDIPPSFDLRVLGGPLGKGVAHLVRVSSGFAASEHEGTMQIPLGDNMRYDEMKSQFYQDRQREMSARTCSSDVLSSTVLRRSWAIST